MRNVGVRRLAAPVVLVMTAGLAFAAPLSRTLDPFLAPAPDAPAPRNNTRLFSSVAPAQADRDGNRLFDDLEARLSIAAAGETLDVVVRYRPGREPAQAPGAGRRQRRLARDRSIATVLTATEIQRLLAD